MEIAALVNRSSLLVITGVFISSAGVSSLRGIDEAGLDWLPMGMGLLGGLALFLFGMEQMANGLKAAAGDRMRDFLARLTTNRFSAALTGAFVTAVIQSSSVTTVLVVGFVSAGMMTMVQSVGVIMGANVGTTITAQIVAFKVEKAALAIVAAGFAMLFVSKSDRNRHVGNVIMGLGLVFYGMSVMGEAMDPLRSYQPFVDAMARMDNPLLGMLAGALFTALVQSSSATTAIVILLASQGFISLDAGITLAFGANLGTCVTALLASLGKTREAVRAAAVHVIFNLAGVLLWLPLVHWLAAVVVDISPQHPELAGSDRLGAEVPRQIANAHTVFNVANTLLFIGFTPWIARFVQRLLPERRKKERLIIEPQFLDVALISTPALALQRVRLEVARLGGITGEMLAQIPAALIDSGRGRLEAIERRDDEVDVLEGCIIRYLGRVRKEPLSDEQSALFQMLMNATSHLEHVGDVIANGMVIVGRKRLDKNLVASETMRHIFRELHGTVCRGLESAVHAVRDGDQKAAQAVLALKDEVNRQIDEALAHQARKLAEDDPHRLDLFRLEVEAVESLKRVYTLSKRLARPILPREVAAA